MFPFPLFPPGANFFHPSRNVVQQRYPFNFFTFSRSSNHSGKSMKWIIFDIHPVFLKTIIWAQAIFFKKSLLGGFVKVCQIMNPNNKIDIYKDYRMKL